MLCYPIDLLLRSIQDHLGLYIEVLLWWNSNLSYLSHFKT